ncbi:MAG: 30S ribosomal protein S4 [Candidatus Paceibacterota bacterium]|jgi:small subunit ribosomal protein S4
MIDIKCKKCRAVGEKLFLKGEKCYTPKCPLIRRGSAIIKGKKKGRGSTVYGKQLKEKQKVKFAYGIKEKQLRRYFNIALKKKTSTPETFAKLIESRFDNIVFRLGFVSSRNIARQLVSHGHFMLNNKKHNIPSTIVKKGDIIAIKESSKKKIIFKEITEKLKKYELPKHLEINIEKLEGKIIGEPDLEELQLPFDFTSIVEFYSK